MKKIKLVSILLVAMLALTLALTACNNSKPLTQEIRWKGYEENVYNVSLQNNQTDESNTKTYNDVVFTKDTVTTTDDYDRIKPSAVEGTYTTTLTINSDGTATYTTLQQVTDTYLADSTNFAYAKALFDKVADVAEDCSFLNATETETSITFESYVATEVTFANDVTLKPVSSKQTIKGYYLGKSNQEVNNLVYETTYQEGVATVKLNGEELHTYEIEGNVVDSLQIALVARTIDQSKTTAQGKFVAPAVTVYDFKTNKLVTLNFAVYNQMYVLLNLPNTNPYAVASVVTVGVQGYTGLLYTYTANANEKFVPQDAVGAVNTYDQVRFQSEYYVYELASYTADQVEDLKYVAPTPEN